MLRRRSRTYLASAVYRPLVVDASPVAHLPLGKENRLSPFRRSSYHSRLSSRSFAGINALGSYDTDDVNENQTEDEDKD